MTTELEQKIAEQAAVIEKLRDVLGEGVGSLHKFSDGFECRCSQCNFVRLKAEALAIPTDSKKILADWLDSVLGEPVEYRVYQINGMCDGHCVQGNYKTEYEADAAASFLGEYWVGTDLLFKKPEIK